MRPPDTDRVLRALGRRVAELRRDAGLTQEQLAENLGYSTKYLQRIEAGRHNLSVRSLVLLAHEIGVTTATLFDRPASMKVQVGRPRSKRP